VAVVLIQDRDRLSREPAYHWLLRKEFEKSGTVIRDPSGRGQDTPMDELATSILDSVAKFERQFTALRMKRGKLEAARKGRILATSAPTYGYQFTPDRKGYVVDEKTMPVVRRIVRMLADGVALGTVLRTLEHEGIPSPQGGRWSKPTIRNILNSPAYEPHPYEEVVGMVAPEVAQRLDPERSYGLWYFNEVPVPIPESGIEREIVLRARSNIAGNRPASSAGRRLWTLSGGIARCSECSGVLEAHTVRGKYFYYQCRRRYRVGPDACSNTRCLPAAKLEERVWREVSGLLDHEKAVRDAFDGYAAFFQGTGSDANRKRLAGIIEKAQTERSGYLRLAAQGRMTDAELDEALAEADQRKLKAERELAVTQEDAKLAREMEVLRDMLLEGIRRGLWSHGRTLREQADLYRQMRLQVTPEAEGDGIGLEWAYGGEDVCVPKSPP
jgi:hypothetical protein